MATNSVRDNQRLKPSFALTGYPRSGTSAGMRMCWMGGIKVLADKKKGNQWNPYGDFELAGKRLKHGLEHWSPRYTAGKLVKVVCPYISDMVPFVETRPVKVIFMLRDIHEIVASLMAMKVVWEFAPDEAIPYAKRFLEHFNVPTLFVKFHEMLEYPKSTAVRIADFLERDLDIDKMVKAIRKDTPKGKQNELTLFEKPNWGVIDDKYLAKDGKVTEISKAKAEVHVHD